EGERDRRQVGGRIGVRQRPPDRAAVTDLWVADLPGGVGQQRQFASEQIGTCYSVMGGQRADRDVTVILAHIAELIQPADIDQRIWSGEAQLHERHQRMTAREKLRVFPGLSGKADSVVDGRGALIGKRCRDQLGRPSLAAARTALTMLW